MTRTPDGLTRAERVALAAAARALITEFLNHHLR
jgi:hypothetical protein